MRSGRALTSLVALVALFGCGGRTSPLFETSDPPARDAASFVGDAGTRTLADAGMTPDPACPTDLRIASHGSGALERLGPPPVVPLGRERILRGLGIYSEGERHEIRRPGVLTQVQWSIWSDGTRGSAHVDVYRRCPSGHVLMRSSELPASTLGRYDGIRSPPAPHRFMIDPPMRVEAGDVITVLVRAEENASLITGVWKDDPYPDGVFVYSDFTTFDPLWDMGAALMVQRSP